MHQKETKIVFQERLNESFQQHQDHVAIENGNCHVTYKQLANKSNHIYQWMINQNIPPDSFIGVCFDNPGDIIPVIIGILKARCVFTILDTSLPRQRLLNMINLTHLKIVFISPQNKNSLFSSGDELNISIIRVDDGFYQNDRIPNLTPGEYHDGNTVLYTREDKIYIYFTSGTTGMPKAFIGMNKSLLHFIDWEIATFNVNKTFRFSQWITPGFDAFLRDVFTPLCAGGVVCIPPRSVLDMAGPGLLHWLNSRHITLIHCVPSIFRLINIFAGKKEAEKNFKALKFIVMSGEKIIPHELSSWFNVFAERIQLVNLYGTSETTMAKTCYFISQSDTERAILPVGKPIPGARVLILDENMQLCPKKFVGEIYIRTPFRTHGYYNDPQANKEKFIPNPFSKDLGDWLHKTGDQGRLLADDNIELLGRLDRQVKIRGIRVELEEIENILAQHPAVAEVAVIDKEKNPGDTYLVAYYVANNDYPGVGDQEKTTVIFVEYLTAHLPSYMLPAFFIPLEKMPLTANGKINRRALPDPQLKQNNYIAPSNETEEKLAVMWSEILDLDKDKISMDADFFRVVGHSLNATILMARIHRLLSVKISLADIFKNPTIRELADYISTVTLPGNRFFAVEPIETKEYYPLSPAQKRIYFLQQLDPLSIAYNIPLVQPLGNSVDIKKI
ncbi:MAG: AMP-binding protein, partial [Acidobacteria bacterium]|nr:AMP-binding protein [Acidobacteriota bacterium]